MASSLNSESNGKGESHVNDLVLGLSEMTIGGTKVPSNVFVNIDKLEHSLKKLGLGKRSLDAVAYSSWLINRHNPIGLINRFFKNKDSAARLHYTVMNVALERPLNTMFEAEFIPVEDSGDLYHLTEFLITNPNKGSLEYRKKIAWVWLNSDEDISIGKKERKFTSKSASNWKDRIRMEEFGKRKVKEKDISQEELLTGVQSSIPAIAMELKRKEAPDNIMKVLENVEECCKQGQRVAKSNMPGFQERLKFRCLQECRELLEVISEYDSVCALLECIDDCEGKCNVNRTK